jgi:kinesin family protein 2/24
MSSLNQNIALSQNDNNNINNQNIPSYLTIPKIRVIVRKRPLGKKELFKNDQDVVDIRNNRQVVVKELKVKVDLTKYIEEHAFNFDLAFDETTTNEQIYLQTVRPMIEAAFHKIKVTCFAYGQTGSGKTFTMLGSRPQIPGLYLLAAFDIFTLLQNYKGYTIWVSFYEIYCGKLFDLLNERKILTAREDGKQNICITGLTEKHAEDINILMQIIEYGLNCRTVGVTGANADSSRSHGIIQIKIKDLNMKDYGKISFIDLAGSERAADTIDVNKQTKFDGAEINKSLLALKECIRALDQDKKHTPFRGSKLTLVLRDSFIGNCKTLMIANISPALGCSEHTLNTLRYASRVKELRAKPEIKIGQGNVNLNFNKNDNNKLDLATIMMMPRQHDNSIKYDVDGNNIQKAKKSKIENKEKKALLNENNFRNNIDSILGNNIPAFSFNNFPSILPSNNIINHNISQNNNNSMRKTSVIKNRENKIKEINNINNNNNAPKNLNNDFNTESSNKENYSNNYEKPEISMAFSFLNDYTSFNEKEKEKEKNINNDNKENIELLELKEKYEKTVNEILIEEKNCLENHKSHIDNMVLTMKNEMNLINILEQKSNVDEYVDKILEIFGEQENKINQMKQKLLGFKRLLKEENELSQKISLLTEKDENGDYNENNGNANDIIDDNEENIINLKEEE